MPRIADVLERESRSVDLEPGDFERLLTRRERKQRNQRIRAGAVAVIVALAVGILLARSLTSNGVPANPPVEPTPAPSVVSGALAYVLGPPDNGIWVANPDGSNAVAITDGLVADGCRLDGGWQFPSWSPDGRYLAVGNSGGCVVVITYPQGNVVANVPAPGGGIAWSPDSTRFAVWDDTGSEPSCTEDGVGTSKIGIYGIDGTRRRQIVLRTCGGGPLVWTPDSTWLNVGDFEVPVGGGTPRDIPFVEAFRSTAGAIWDAALAYSPDGSQVAYGTRHALVVARSDWSESREVLGDPAHSAVWSPNGELLAVASDPRGGPLAPNQLRLVDPANGSATLLFEGEPGTWLTVIGFSPDGDRVLFGEQRPVVGQPEGIYLYSLWSVGLDGSDAREIVVGTTDGVVRPT